MPDMTRTRPAAPQAGPAPIVTPDDARYQSLLAGYNHRFTARPGRVRLPATTEQVVDAVGEAVAADERIALRSGGHCFEDFAAPADTDLLLDLSQLAQVDYDPQRRAFVVGSGVTLGRLYPILFKNWGVTVPGGTCFEVGVGGHIPGGGYGPLSRRDGLVVDHVYAVEVVVVDEPGRARAIVATREADDPHRDLWWAHTGGGGGSFGVVTRFWLRSPGIASDDPTRLLPRAPGAVRRRDVLWSWDAMTERSLTTLLRNYCRWFEGNSAPDSPAANLWSNLIVTHRSSGMFGMTAIVDDDLPDAEKLLDGQFQAITAGLAAAPTMDDQRVVPWLSEWLPSYSWPNDPRGRYKHKAGLLRSCYTDRQLAAIYRHLADDGYQNPTAGLVLTGYGGRVNAVSPDATAIAQRDCILKASYTAGVWQSPDEDDTHIGWVRRYYRDVYADTGGVPVPDQTNHGSYIGYPDVDLADPAWNTSGVPWSTLYYEDNYPRLQQIKRRYDPGDVFRHALSIRPAG